MSEKTLEMAAFHDAGSKGAKDFFLDACAILAAHGHASGLAGQVTLRDGDSTRMLTLRLGAGLEEASADSLLLVDQELQTLEGKGRPNPGTRFHSWIYQRHPKVRAIVHTHPPAASALSMLGIPLPVAHMDSCMFYEDCGFLAHWPGVPTGDEEGALISEALGGRRSAFLANHGFVCTGQSLQEATYLNVFGERAARMALDALSVGAIHPVEPGAAREAHDFLMQPSIVNATFDYWARQARA
ncbi:aldolase [Caenimonas soli]|uniref:aldolase n=1 Tax=Caenimonas soli TaxID=2735555 RepID=UPI001554BAA3|nr:aldolase [Caenimonas soli]NPC57886.1 aldolase [Caenimonas soli]